MKNKLKKAATACCAAICAIACAGCASVNPGASTMLGKPKETVKLTYEQKTDENFVAYIDSLDGFSSKLAAEAVKVNTENNFSVSPISAYMALALAAECSAGDTRTEILSALNTDYNTLSVHFADLYNLLNVANKEKSKVLSTLNLTNSVWINDGTAYKQECVDSLSQKFYAYSYKAPFFSDNDAANKAVKSFIKERTKGLINIEFKIPEETLFTLINTLYWKDVWNHFGDELKFTENEQSFKNADGTAKNLKLLQGNYINGKTAEFDNFKSFYAQTYGGYKLKFIVPDEGVSVKEVFTAENISAVNSADFTVNAVDEENKIQYYTRCVFPEFSTECSLDLKDILKDKFGITNLFVKGKCDYSNFTEEGAYCESVQHITKLKIDRKGGEGAAATVIINAPTSAEPIYRNEYEDFIVDRAFGFVLTDSNGVQLFAGIVDKI